ncbi:MAG: hypothetical protein IH627_14915 [Rubrivivax sp.]|nr:hypothetical protein [Rubrivivax sp.]
MWIPEWLYERLPLLYLVCGCACLWGLGESFAVKLSALLFFAAAALTFGMRRHARRPVVARKRLPSKRR